MAAPAGLAAGLLVLVQSDLVTRVVARAAEEALEAATGEELTIGRIEVGYVPLRVEVQGIVLSHPPTGDTIAAVRSIRAEPGFDGWKPVLRRVTIDAPQVALHLDADGLREFRGVPTAASSAPRPSRLPWKELVIRDGAFSLTTPDAEVAVRGIGAQPGVGGTTDLVIDALRVRAGAIDQRAEKLSFPGITLAPDRIAVPAIDVRFDAITLDGGFAVVDGGPLGGDLSLHVDLGRLTGTDPTRPHVDGRIDLDAALGGTTGAPAVDGSVAVEGLVIWRVATKGGLTATRIGDAFGPGASSPARGTPPPRSCSTASRWRGARASSGSRPAWSPPR
ncbi:MAG: hypothetical protein ACK4YP_10610, partial [Myxococcota bacterium]